MRIPGATGRRLGSPNLLRLGHCGGLFCPGQAAWLASDWRCPGEVESRSLFEFGIRPVHPLRPLPAAFAAFALWGLFPLYWHRLDHLGALDITAHRNVWCLLALLLWLPLIRRPWRRAEAAGAGTAAATSLPKVLGFHFVAGALLAANWLIFIWAATSGHIIEGSLGYFLNPLVSIGLGAMLLGERLSRRQQVAVLLAALGVAVPLLTLGKLPWIALSLAVSFSLYGLMGKRSPLNSQPGLLVESALLVPLALLWLGWPGRDPSGWAALAVDPPTTALLLGGGLVTLVPLVLFGAAARGLPLSTLGIVQFITPTLQFGIGWLAYGEPMPPPRWLSFALIWTGVVLYIVELRRQARLARLATPVDHP